MDIRNSLRQLPQIISRRAQIWHIVEKIRQKETGFVGLQDFSLRRAGLISLEEMAAQPAITLYALNHHRREAIFVETDPDVDLMAFPFLNQAQYEHARRVITMPYALFHQLAGMISHPSRPIILIYSVGRCGSTLLRNVFNNLENVLSLSEPEAFTEIVRHRRADGGNGAEMKALARSILRVQCRPAPGVDPRFYVIKFRSFSTVILDLLFEVAPDATQIFLYRNAEDRARSAARAFKIVEAGAEAMDAATLQKRSQFVPILRQPKYSRRAVAGELSWMEFSMLAWLSGMDQILRLQEAGVPIIPVRYEDMITAPRDIVAQLFALSGIAAEEVTKGIQAFKRDSQKGSSLAQTELTADKQNQFTAAHREQLHRLLCEHPRIQDPDFRIPQTLSPATID